MVGTIFKPAMVSSLDIYCHSLSLSDNEWLDSLTYIESITDATNDVEETENNKQC